MVVTRVYYPGPLKEKTTVQLDQRAFHHLVTVLRAKVGDQLVLFNGEGGEYLAVLSRLSKKSAEVEVQAFNNREVESPLRICLAQGVARGEKMDFIIQKAVELGVHEIIPLTTERSNVQLKGEREMRRQQHWEGVAASACEQCGRNTLPTIAPIQSFQSWLPQANADYCFVLSPHVSDRLPAQLRAAASVLLLIGPEGGLSEQEVTAAKAHGFLPLSLGPRVLRTETASLAAITMLQTRFGDMNKS